jgi:putative Ig domain-containing protein
MSGIVQQNSGTTTGTSIAVAFNNPVSKGNLIIVGIFTPSANPNAIGDGTNIYNISSDGNPGPGFNFNVYYAKASANGTPTITVNFASSTVVHLHIFEVSGGYDTAEQFGANYNGTNSLNGTVSTSGSTTHATSFVFAMFADNFGSGVTWTPGSGYTAGQTTANNNVVFSEGGEINGAGVQTATASQNFSSVIGSVIATFYASGNPTITTTVLPSGSQVQAYSATLAATGGTLPYNWSIISGSLPPGLSLNSSTGVISGTPTAGGFFAFTVQVTDSASNTATASLSITVAVLLGGGYWAHQKDVRHRPASSPAPKPFYPDFSKY